jgi:replicative DNA helicase
MIQSNEYAIEVTAELLPDDFNSKELRLVYSFVSEMLKNGEDVNELAFMVKYSGKLKEIGLNVTKLGDVMANMTLLKPAIKKQKETVKIIKLLSLSDNIRNKIESGEDPNEVIPDIEKALTQLEGTSKKREYLSPKEMAIACLETAAARMDEATRAKKCVYTGFKSINRVTGGLEAGDLIILSGSTGGGKSAFAANIAKDVAMVQKLPCVYINSEMSAEQMALRWDALLGNVSHTSLRSGTMSGQEFVNMTAKLDMLNNSELHTLTMPDLRVDSVISEIRRYKTRFGIRMVIVDYIGRCDFSDSKNKEDWQMLTGAARRLKTLAQEQNLIVLMLAQLNESGRLAQASYMSHEADLWINLKKIPDDEKFDGMPWNIILQINKARNAAVGKIPLYFWGDRLLFTDNEQEATKYDTLARYEQQQRDNQRVDTGTSQNARKDGKRNYY